MQERTQEAFEQHWHEHEQWTLWLTSVFQEWASENDVKHYKEYAVSFVEDGMVMFEAYFGQNDHYRTFPFKFFFDREGWDKDIEREQLQKERDEYKKKRHKEIEDKERRRAQWDKLSEEFGNEERTHAV